MTLALTLLALVPLFLVLYYLLKEGLGAFSVDLTSPRAQALEQQVVDDREQRHECEQRERRA